MEQDTGERAEQLRQRAATARRQIGARLEGMRSTIRVKALIAAVLGLCVLFWPTASLGILIQAIALLIVIDGIFGVVAMLRAKEQGAFLGQATLSIVLGVIVLLWPEATMTTLILLLGAWALVVGAMLLWSVRNLPSDVAYGGAQQTVGIVLVIVGTLLMIWPGLGVVGLSWVIGIALVIVALALFWLSTRMGRMSERIGGENGSKP